MPLGLLALRRFAVARIYGARVHGDRLRRLSSPNLRNNVADVVEEGLGKIVKTAADSIIEGAISGPGHVASAPGEPPNADTHELDQSGKVEMNRSTLSGKATFSAPHAIPQEFGTEHAEERPYLRPAGQKERPGIRRDVARVIKSASRGAA